MTFDELKNGMKSLFSSLGAKTSDSNYGVALLDKTSGEPKGFMGMSDLASVLGGVIISSTPIASGGTVEIEVPFGIYRFSDSQFGTDCGIYAISTGEIQLLSSGNTFKNRITSTFVSSSGKKATLSINNGLSSNCTLYVMRV